MCTTDCLIADISLISWLAQADNTSKIISADKINSGGLTKKSAGCLPLPVNDSLIQKLQKDMW